MLITFLSNLRIFPILLASILIAGLYPLAASGQARTFTYEGSDYVIEFPSTQWRALRPSGLVPARTRKEFIYTGGDDVRLLVRRKMVDPNVTTSDMARLRQVRDSHLPGYVTGSEESFDGPLGGTKYSYGYTRGGVPMAGLVYYLEADGRTVYSLHFTGTSGEMRGLGSHADSIARGFHLK